MSKTYVEQAELKLCKNKDMNRKRRIIIAGFAEAARSSGSRWFARTSIADYINEMSVPFDECIWFTACRESKLSETGFIDNNRVRVIPFQPRLSHIFFNFFQLVWCFLNRDIYFIFHLPTMLTVAWASPLFRILSKKSFVYIGSDYEKILADFDEKWFGWKLFYRLSHELSMRTAHGVIARGKYLSELARKYNPTVIETVPVAHISPTSLESNKSKRQVNSRYLRVLYIGKIRDSKGIGDLLTALDILYSKNKMKIPIELDIVGDGPDVETFKQKADSLECSSHIHFHGWVGEKAKIDTFFSEAHVLVVPSSTHPEGVPRVIDEALMHRVPVISTKIGGIEKEFSENEILLVETSSPRALANALEKMLFDLKTQNFYLHSSKRRVMRWQEYGSAAKQHTSLLLEKSAREDTKLIPS